MELCECTRCSLKIWQQSFRVRRVHAFVEGCTLIIDALRVMTRASANRDHFATCRRESATAASFILAEDQDRAPQGSSMIALIVGVSAGGLEFGLSDGTPVKDLGYEFSESVPNITFGLGFGIETDRFLSNPFASGHGQSPDGLLEHWQ